MNRQRRMETWTKGWVDRQTEMNKQTDDRHTHRPKDAERMIKEPNVSE